MTLKKWRLQFSIIFASAFTLLLVNSLSIYVVAQSAALTSQTPVKRNRVRKAPKLKYTLPPKGAPGQRADAGSRSGCSTLEQRRLIALVPPTNIGLTIATRPTFWFYIPLSSTETRALGKFQLLDEQENIIYTTNIPLNSTNDITSINLPKNLAPLETGKKYQWVLSFVCDETSTEASILVNGYIERVAVTPQLQQKLNIAATPRDRILIYAENGLWFDMLTALATERRNKPQDMQLAKDWKDLLSSPEVELPELVK